VSENGQITVKQITINVIVQGKWVIPIDREGNPIGQKMLFEKVNGIANQHDFEWALAIKRMISQVITDNRLSDPWVRKIESLRTSLVIRRRDQPFEKTKRDRRFEIQTWDEAVPRLVAQIKANNKRASSPEWFKWSENIARNHRKKAR
jgi:hypothetical protein